MPHIMTTDSSSARKTTVLLADDESATTLLFAMDLTRRGYCVLQANSGSEAGKISAECPTPIDVLVTDWNMPDLSRDELARRLLLERPEIKVILMSGHPDAADVIDSFAKTQALFLRKPLSPARLGESINQLLNLPNNPSPHYS
jgi:two-component system cell cycle sensor histidine kinase/response regulator CckA